MAGHEDRRRDHRGTRGGRGRGMGYHRLQELSHFDSKQLLNIVSNSQSGFAELLKSRNLQRDWICIILGISAKVCEYTQEPITAKSGISAFCGKIDNSMVPSALLMTFLNYVRNSSFLMRELLPFISGFLTETNVSRRRCFCETVEKILVLCKTTLIAMPNNVMQIMPVLSTIDMVVRNMRMSNSLHDDAEMATHLSAVLMLCNEVMTDQSRQIGNDGQRHEHRNISLPDKEREPPSDFREMSIFPIAEDLHSCTFVPYNKVYGKYVDTERYLDTHFRLLREDFMRPLRNGIRQYLDVTMKPVERNRLQNIRIYQDVHILLPICNSDGISYRVTFDVTRMQDVRWENTKRLIYGALVCLSPDSFTTVYFATVSHRDADQLRRGLLELRFQGATEEVSQIGTNQKLVMAESSAYFEAYRHVLLGLKAMNEQSLPFPRYLVNCDKHVEKPQYLLERQGATYDLQHLVFNDTCAEERSPALDYDSEDDMPTDITHRDRELENMLRQIPILRNTLWPSADRLNLDGSQLRALQEALTNELAIIQGPPGTGKTYIGLRIVRTLLQNSQFWNNNEVDSPILLICYTNHALDQFLEGISRFLHSGIVRVGGRSKSEILERFMLRELRKGVRERKDIPVDVHRNRMDAMDEMDRMRLAIQKNVADVEASAKGLLSETLLEEYMRDRHFDQLTEGVTTGSGRDGEKSNLSRWLGLKDGSALMLYEEIISKEVEHPQIMNTDTEPDDTDTENEPEAEIDKLADRRLIHGLDNINTKDKDFRQKRMMEMALEKLSLKFLECSFGGKRRNKKNDIDQAKKEENKIQLLLERSDLMTSEEAKDVRNVWDLDLNGRWRLYRRWLEMYRHHINQDLRGFEVEYELAARRLHEVTQQEDLEIMRKAKILGMTTTGAARYREVLHQIQPKLIIVEEAAEVLEAHIIASLTPGCKHLILIGDHKQLRPNPTDYKLAEVHKLKVSMFERLVTNGLPYVTLELQHRMPPNISRILHHVYKELKDHPSVINCEPIKGIATNLYFIDHDKEETQNDDLQSKTNQHEANYIVALCRYLLLQGYQQTQITILTPYIGQLSNIRNLLRRKDIRNVRASAIDNFQGEENDIILVSLVRSNQEAKIGFLGENNRICVALSRARKAMYLVGNAAILGQMNELWSKVIQTLQANEQIGKALKLCCGNHPESAIYARNAKDFENSPEGGCMKPCQARLKCGHVCPSVCHAYDQEHVLHKCRKKCAKLCAQKHQCKKMCFEECGHCQVIERRWIPNCGHTQNIPCHEHTASYKCQAQCTTKLKCHHLCQNKCGEAHTKVCHQIVTRTLLCGHNAQMRCSDDPESFICITKCTTHLSCDHACSGTCGECAEGRLHKPCSSPCKRILVCDHQCDAPCTRDCPPCSARCPNRCPHSICQEVCGKPCVPCIEPCAWRCRHHNCSRKCNELCDRPRCNESCKEKLPCGHDCIGVCGEPCPKKCRICDIDEVQNILFGTEDEEDARFVELEDCGHVLEVTGMDKWMDDDANKSDCSVGVKLKSCPLCSTAIRQNLRYGTIIKKELFIIETIKSKILGHHMRGIDLRRELLQSLGRLRELDQSTMNVIEGRLRGKDDQLIAEDETNCIKNSVQFLCSILKLDRDIKAQFTDDIYSGELQIKMKTMRKDMAYFRSWALKERVRLGEQETEEAQMELFRLNLVAKSIECQIRIQMKQACLPAVVERGLQRAILLLKRKTPLNKNDQAEIERTLKEVDKIVPCSGLGISEEERVQIVKAMGLAQGHWFKCKNGHVYVIGDCGGATVESKCPTCDSIIGGTSHTLHGDNELASEMDNARHAAWSDMANMQNYHHADLQ